MFNRLRHYCQSFKDLTWSERWWLTQGLLLLPLIAMALHFYGLCRLQALLARGVPRPKERLDPADLGMVLGMARMLRIAARCGCYQAACLPRSLVLWWWLRRLGIGSELRIGVRQESGTFAAHAWIECQGLVLNDTADIHQYFAAFDGDILPAEASRSNCITTG